MDDKQILDLLKRTQPKKANFSKAIVSIVILLNVIFTAVVIWVFYKTGKEPTTLIQMWFGFTGVELLSLAVVKVGKIKESSKNV
jgi:hypothetical protein